VLIITDVYYQLANTTPTPTLHRNDLYDPTIHHIKIIRYTILPGTSLYSRVHTRLEALFS